MGRYYELLGKDNLSPDELSERSKLADLFYKDIYFNFDTKPLTATEEHRFGELLQRMRQRLPRPERAQINREFQVLLKRKWNRFHRTDNDILLSSILRNEPFPVHTRVLKPGSVVIGEFPLQNEYSVGDFAFRYWATYDECFPGFEKDCEIGRQDQANRK